MNRLWWHLQPLLARLGLAGHVGLGFLLVALLGKTLWLGKLQTDYEQLGRHIKRPAHAAASSAASDTAIEPLAAFPERRDMPQLLLALQHVAQRHGLTLPQGEYRAKAAATGSSITWVSVSLPVSGSYLALRQMLDEVRDRYPAFALTGLQLSRSAIANTTLEARIEWTLGVKEARP